MKKFLHTCAILAGLTFGASANAGLVTDVIAGGDMPGNGYVGYGLSGVTYYHDLTGFTPGQVLSGEIIVELFDDNACEGVIECGTPSIDFGFFTIPGVPGLEDSLPELGLVIVAGLDLDTGGLAPMGTWSNTLGDAALAAANEGLLAVTILSFGGLTDFNIASSTLRLALQDVPAPATVALFGLGLASLVATRRKRSARR